MEPTPTPHDCFFRENFGRPAIGQDFLRGQLPAALLAEVDLTTLTIAKDTYVSPELRQVYSDLVYWRLMSRNSATPWMTFPRAVAARSRAGC